MGGALNKQEIQPLSKEMFKFLKKMYLAEVYECCHYKEKHYNGKQYLNEEEFDDIFSPVLNDTEIFFKKLQSGGKCCFYETFCGLVLFSKGGLEEKVKCLYKVFDYDENGVISEKELHVFIRACLFGLCKIVNLPLPTEDKIPMIASDLLKKQAPSKSNEMTYDDLACHVKCSDEIQDFLLKFTGLQTSDRAKKKYENIVAGFKKVFDKQSIEFMGDKYMTSAVLNKELKTVMKDVDESMIAKLIHMLDSEKRGAISEYDYMAVMKPWAAFSATDINQTGELEASEIKTLISLLEGEEPSEYRMQRDLKILGVSEKGVITRMNWIKYLSSSETGQTGEVFNFSLKRDFDLFDRDRDGIINLDELHGLLKSSLLDLTKGKSSGSKKLS